MWSASKTATAARELLLLTLLTAGCAAPPPPKAKPAAPEPTPAPVPTPAPTPAPTPEPQRDDLVVIEPGGGSDSSSVNLVEASRRAREQKAHAAPPAHVITD